MGVAEATAVGVRDTWQVRWLHGLARIHGTFDDSHLVSRAGSVPAAVLAERAGLGGSGWGVCPDQPAVWGGRAGDGAEQLCSPTMDLTHDGVGPVVDERRSSHP